MNDSVLNNVKVIDLTQHIAGPYCTKLLADYGADVIKVERPDGGDPARRMGPFPGHEPHLEKSGLFLYLNTNKRGVTLDLKSDSGRAALLELVRGADVLVESYSPRVMASLDLDYETLSKTSQSKEGCYDDCHPPDHQLSTQLHRLNRGHGCRDGGGVPALLKEKDRRDALEPRAHPAQHPDR